MSVRIRADFDGGNIDVLSASDPRDVRLAIRNDTNAEFRQWFHFRLEGAARREHALRLVNAGEATYPDAFEGYTACASYDDKEWFRVPTEFDGKELVILHEPTAPRVHYAYFAPFPHARHRALVQRAAASGRCRVERVGQSVQRRAMDLLVVGEEAEEKLKIWVTARQHPGETMAEWFVEGMLERLLDAESEVAAALLERAVFYVVPNMNPDGGVLGNLRANAAGVNLNRVWNGPDAEKSPEVLGVRERMLRTGVDMFLDVHGDERNPYCFVAGCEGNPSYSSRIEALEELFVRNELLTNYDFQDEYGYPRDEPGEGDLSTAGNWVGETFDCLSLTVEMPFKDNANAPDPENGWSPERAAALGHTTLEAIVGCLDALRADGFGDASREADDEDGEGEVESESDGEDEGEGRESD